MADDDSFPTRREFTLEAALALLASVTIAVSGCGGGGDGGSSPTGPSPQPGDVVGAISANHGHTARVTSAQLTAGNAIALNIRGTSDHPHTLTLSQGELMQISASQRVSKESSSDDGHTHIVTFN